jgi:hypothetical protein
MRNFLPLKFIVRVKEKNDRRKSSLPSVMTVIATLFVLSSLLQMSLVSGAYVHSGVATGASMSSVCSVTSNGQEEKYIYTYAVSAKNHLQAYAITGASVFRNVVGSAYKVYLFVYIHPATTIAISTAGTVKTCTTMLNRQTDNMYWDASNGIGGRTFATIGGDLVPDKSSGQMLFDQYINVNAYPGQTPRNLASVSGPSCSVSTGGQNRNSVYMLFIDDTNKQHAYIITGSSIAQISVGGVESTAFYVYLSSQEIGAGTSPGSGSCSMNLSHGMSSFEWALRAPPSGNYRIYGTLGGDCPQPNSGTIAGLIDQYTDSKYQF